LTTDRKRIRGEEKKQYDRGRDDNVLADHRIERMRVAAGLPLPIKKTGGFFVLCGKAERCFARNGFNKMRKYIRGRGE